MIKFEISGQITIILPKAVRHLSLASGHAGEPVHQPPAGERWRHTHKMLFWHLLEYPCSLPILLAGVSASKTNSGGPSNTHTHTPVKSHRNYKNYDDVASLVSFAHCYPCPFWVLSFIYTFILFYKNCDGQIRVNYFFFRLVTVTEVRRAGEDAPPKKEGEKWGRVVVMSN